MTSLSLFGVIHFDTPEKVTSEVDDFLGDADVIFIERSPEPITPGVLLTALARNPLGTLGLLLWTAAIHYPLELLFNHDLQPTEVLAVERVADRRGLPVHEVDENPFVVVSNCGIANTLVQWAVFGAIAVLTPLNAALTTLLLLAGLGPLVLRRRGGRLVAIAWVLGWFVAGFALFVAWLVSLSFLSAPLLVVTLLLGHVAVIGTVADRNEHMLDRIDDISRAEGYDDAVLVTGKAHLGGLVQRARGRGIAVPRVHVSAWRSAGETHEHVDAVNLPAVGDGRPTGRVLAAGSERTVLRSRIAAALLDAVVLFLLSILATIVLVIGVWELVGPAGIVAADLAIGTVGLLGVPLGFLVLQEWGQATTGNKEVRGLVVADADDGTAPSLRAVVLRNALRPVDALGVGLLVMYVTDRNQRLGDLVAGTVVGERIDPAEQTTDSEPYVAEEGPADGASQRSMPGATDAAQGDTAGGGR